MATRIPPHAVASPPPALPQAPQAHASSDPNPLEGLPAHSPIAGLRQAASPAPRLSSQAPTTVLRAIQGAQPTGQALSGRLVPAGHVAPALRRTRIGPEDTS
ncbi:hypothetical protein ACT80S_07270 [Ramlibacter sp. MAHUQ-53]|uniref:hypothetical protein n=1 Tax=unclassified Ramlibacter TaxID=2617605 RepID=UPI00363164E3